MSLGHGASVVRSGLVLQYDMANTAKSWKGAPTTNLLSPNGNNFTAWGNNAVIVTPNATLSPDGAYNGSLLYVNSAGGSRSVAYGGYPTGGSFTVYLKAAASTSCSVGIYTGTGWSSAGGCAILSGPGAGAGSGASTLYNISGLSTTEWTRVHVYSTAAGGTAYIYPGGTGNTAGYSVYAYNAQVEALAIPSAYTDSSRSTTQAVIDLTNNNTLTATSLTYASDNTFSFTGASSSSLMTSLPMTATPALSNFTYEVLLNITALPAVAGNNGVILGATSYGGAAIYWTSNGITFNVNGFIRGADLYRTTAPYTLALNTFYHIVMTNNYSAGTLNLYINGILFSSVPTATQEYNPAFMSNAGNIGINKAQIDGGGAATYTYFTGKIAAAKIYSRALTAAEVSQNFEALRGRYGI
jgi:hypothetical protein